ncbi:MAG: isoleucine--tRNA ligase [bacterium]
MYKPVEKNVSFPALEERLLKFWEDKEIFRKTDLERQGNPEFVFYDGPPGTNGVPHIGHMMQSALKDLWPRYKTMNGFHVIRKAGWDTHGLPIELTAEKELKLKSKRDIQAFGEEKYIDYCRSTVFRYKDRWEEAIRRVGRFLDMSDPYMTLTNDYIQSDWYLLKLAREMKLDPDRPELQGKEVSPRWLYKDYRIMPYCCRCGTTLSNFEVAEGYKDVVDMTLTAKFPVKGEANLFIAAWTTTTWTLLSNVALAVGPDVDYAAVKLLEDCTAGMAGDTVILAKERLEAYQDALGKYETVWFKKGRDLAGMTYEPLWDWQKDSKAHRVIADEYVTTEDGTGVVHLALYGEDDFRIIRREGFPLVQNVNDHGYCEANAGQYAGRYFKEAEFDIDVLKDLHARGLLLAKQKHEHSYPFCYRCDAHLMYFARPGWFIRTASYRQEMLTANSHINWQPGHIKAGRFGNWLENTIDWNVTRERYWGSPLPLWTCDEPGCKGEICFGNYEELKAAAEQNTDEALFNEKIGHVDLHKPLIDRVTVPCPDCGKSMTRENFVLDSWFNAGLMFIGQWGYPATPGSKEIFARQYPADFICEAIDQTRGWFYTLVATSTLFALGNKLPEDQWSCYKNVICTDLVLDDEGHKMSKSKGNVINPMGLFDEIGADATRWSFYVTNPWNVRRFSTDYVKESVRDVLLPLWNAYSFFVTYAGVDGWKPSPDDQLSERPLDRWILGELTRLNSDVTAHLEKYDVAPAANSCVRFLDQLTNWYIRRSRRRFWKSEDDQDKHNAYVTLHRVLKDFSLILAPFLPFLTEEIYQNIVCSVDASAPESIHLAKWPEPVLKTIDEELAEQMRTARDVVRIGRDLRQKHNIKVRQPLSELTIAHRTSSLASAEDIQELIYDELNVKKLTFIFDDSDLVQLQAKANFKALGPRFGKEVNKIAGIIKNLPESDICKLDLGESVVSEGIEIMPEDVIVERQAPEHLAVGGAGDLTVALNLSLTDDLIYEGVAREIMHGVQITRKEMGLEVADRISIEYYTDGLVTCSAIASNEDWIKAETLAIGFKKLEETSNSLEKSIEVDKEIVYYKIEKAETT